MWICTLPYPKKGVRAEYYLLCLKLHGIFIGLLGETEMSSLHLGEDLEDQGLHMHDDGRGACGCIRVATVGLVCIPGICPMRYVVVFLVKHRRERANVGDRRFLQ